MIFRKDILRFWAIFCVILAVALGVITLVHRWHRVFPSDEVSDIYMKYAEREDIDVSFVKKYRVNDTVFVDVTLLEAKDTTAWEELCKDFDIASITQFPVEFRESLTVSNSYSLRVIKDSTDTDCGVEYSRNVIIFSYPKMSMCIFHNMNYKQYNAIVDKNVKNISN